MSAAELGTRKTGTWASWKQEHHATHGDVAEFLDIYVEQIPGCGGWRFVGRSQGGRNRAATPGKPKNQCRNPKMGYAFVHTVIDDHSRVAYAEVHDDETAPRPPRC